jgi:hypothetical protein
VHYAIAWGIPPFRRRRLLQLWKIHVHHNFIGCGTVLDTRRNLAEGRECKCTSSTFSTQNLYFCYWIEDGHKRIWWESEGKLCICINDWFKPNFFLFLAWILRKLKFEIPVIAGPSGRAVCGRSPAEIVGLNTTGDMDVCLLWVLCVVRQRSLRRADHWSRGVPPNVVRRCVWSRNLVNKEALAHCGLSHQKQTKIPVVDFVAPAKCY